MNDILSIIEELANDPSKNAKIEILKKHSNNELLKDILTAAYDPNINYWIRKIPMYYMTKGPVASLSNALEELTHLSDRTYTGHAGINHLKNILGSLDSRDAKVVEKIIDRDMKAGFSATTINKVWAKLIPEFKIMLASRSTKKTVAERKFPVLAQTKEDGMRINIFVQDGEVEFISRGGKSLIMHDNLTDEVLAMAQQLDPPWSVPNVVYDGELLYRENGVVADRKKGNGFGNKAVKGTIKPEEAKNFIVQMWDVVTVDEFNAGISPKTEVERQAKLKDDLKNIDSDRVGMVDMWEIHNQDDLDELFQNMLSEGKEGLIVKDPNGTWENKRSNFWVKMKNEDTMEVEVIGWQEGKPGTKYVGKLGALIVTNKDKTLKGKVGSGFSDKQRIEFTEEYSVGKIITVKYNERIKARNATVEKFFISVFVEFRDDKNEAD